MAKYEQRMKKIGYRNQDELIDQINKLEVFQVLSVDNDVIPESTDTRSWAEIHYLVKI